MPLAASNFGPLEIIIVLLFIGVPLWGIYYFLSRRSCPVCGLRIKRGLTACPKCGTNFVDGWQPPER
jgi:hypothetical protein